MKCNNCGNEVSGVSKDLICPACGGNFSFENIYDLVSCVIEHNGISIVSNHGAFISTLRDYAPYLNDDIRLIQIAVDAGVYDELLAADGKSDIQKKNQIKKSIEKLKSSYFLEEAQAVRSIEIIVNCMGWHPTLLNGIPISFDVNKPVKQSLLQNIIPFFKKVSNIARIIAVLIVVTIIVAIVLLVKSCSSPNNNDNTPYSNSNTAQDMNNGPNDSQEPQNGTTPDITISTTTSERDSSNSTAANSEETTQPTKKYIPISGKSISGNLTVDDQIDYYTYTAPKTGTYRFDFDINDVGANYDVNIIDSKNSTICSSSYSNSYHGASVHLTANEKYTIEIEQRKNYCNYSINIGVPNDITAISGNSFSGDIKYRDQENTYTYTAPRNGIYRFDFSISDTTANYGFMIKDNKNSTECEAYYSSLWHGTTVNLKAGVTYTIIVYFSNNFCDYKVSIGVPSDISTVTGNTIKGAITYRDQENTYTYTAPKTGEYHFKPKISDTNANYDITIKSSNNSKIASANYYGYYYSGFDVSLTAGKTYTIIISYKYLMCDYTIDITTP